MLVEIVLKLVSKNGIRICSVMILLDFFGNFWFVFTMVFSLFLLDVFLFCNMVVVFEVFFLL